jgi:RNA polymerase sigma-70 factor (ECF subfamily)
MSDRAWIRDALERHERQLVAFAARITGDVELARDVVQDAFLALCRERRHEIEPRVAEWLFTVVRNRSLDVVRKDGHMSAEEVDVEHAGEERSPAALLETREEGSRVLAMLEQLPAKQREALRLKFQAGLSYREIAQVTGSSIGNVGFLVHVGLKALRERMTVRGKAVEGQVL